MRRMGLSAVIALALITELGPVSRAQTLAVSMGSTRIAAAGVTPVSPSVVATYQFSSGDATLLRMQTLVLWRGSAGWHARRPADRSAQVPS